MENMCGWIKEKAGELVQHVYEAFPKNMSGVVREVVVFPCIQMYFILCISLFCRTIY